MGIESFLTSIYPEETPAQEGLIFNKDVLTINLDKFGYHQPNNILYVTGLSGSGKTTQTFKLSKEYGARVLSTDEIIFGDLTHNTDSYRFMEKAKKKYPDYASFLAYRQAKQWTEFSKLRDARKREDPKYMDKLWTSVLTYICDLVKSDKDHLYILEGIHIFEFLKDYIDGRTDSMVIRGESVVTAINRYIRRAGSGNWFKGLWYELIQRKDLHELVYWEYQLEKELDEFKKKMQYDHE